MVDVQKIDSVFNDKESFVYPKRTRLSFRLRVVRILKLFLPSVAAVLIALMLIFPSMKKEIEVASNDLTNLKKGEIEKLHVEKTTFSMTDSDGKISSFTADLMDETEPGSQIVKIINPKGAIPLDLDGKKVDVSSEIGFYNQADNVVLLQQNVVAIYDQTTTIKTQEAEYDFKKAFGYGTQKVYAFGDWGNLVSDSFSYDKNKDLLTLIGNSKIEHDKSTLYANKEIRYEKNKNQIEAEGKVRLDQEDSTLYADRVKILFDSADQMKIKKIEAFDHVSIETKDGNAKGNYGLYLPDKDEVWLEGDVMIEKDGHLVFGDKAVTNTKTSVSHLMSNSKNRVSGVIRGSVLKGKKHEKE